MGYHASLQFFSLHKVTSCDVRSLVVEVEVRCVKPGLQTRHSCRSSKIRHAPGREHASNVTMFSSGDNPRPPYMGEPSQLLHDMAEVDLATRSSTFNAFQTYLYDPITGFGKTMQDGDEFAEIPKEAFEARLGLLMNTFWAAVVNPYVILNTPKDEMIGVAPHGNSTSTTSYETLPTYRISAVWLGIYAVAVAILALATVGNLWLRFTVRVPDFLDSVSALTRDTPFVDRPDEASSALGSAEQMKLLGDRWVRIQDVQPSKAVGRIALSDDRALRSQVLEWDRLYE